jgi:hypothetical protein
MLIIYCSIDPKGSIMFLVVLSVLVSTVSNSIYLNLSWSIRYHTSLIMLANFHRCKKMDEGMS